jgi:hypothetical protein
VFAIVLVSTILPVLRMRYGCFFKGDVVVLCKMVRALRPFLFLGVFASDAGNAALPEANDFFFNVGNTAIPEGNSSFVVDPCSSLFWGEQTWAAEKCFAKKAGAGDYVAALALAKIHYKNGEQDATMKALIPWVERGEPKATFMFGQSLVHFGAYEDRWKGINLMKKAYKKDPNPDYALTLGRELLSSPFVDVDMGQVLLHEAAAAGVPGAQKLIVQTNDEKWMPTEVRLHWPSLWQDLDPQIFGRNIIIDNGAYNTFVDKCDALYFSGEESKFERCLIEAGAATSNDAGTLLALRGVRHRSGDADGATKLLTKAMELGSLDARFLFGHSLVDVNDSLAKTAGFFAMRQAVGQNNSPDHELELGLRLLEVDSCANQEEGLTLIKNAVDAGHPGAQIVWCEIQKDHNEAEAK